MRVSQENLRSGMLLNSAVNEEERGGKAGEGRGSEEDSWKK